MGHTKEPWYYVIGAAWTTEQGPDDGGACILRADRNDPHTSPTERDANVQRAIACVNACAGINPDAIPDLLEACGRLVTLMDESDQWSDAASGTALGAIVNEARAAIAKAKGQ